MTPGIAAAGINMGNKLQEPEILHPLMKYIYWIVGCHVYIECLIYKNNLMYRALFKSSLFRNV